MGGCCAPGTLGTARRVPMGDGISISGEMKGAAAAPAAGADSSCGDVAELTKEEGRLGAAAQVLHAAQESSTEEKREKTTTVDVEKLLQVLEVAVEREYVESLRDQFNASHCQYQENIASSHDSSLAESATSIYSATSMLSENGSIKNNRSLGDGESCSLGKGNASFGETHRPFEGKQSIDYDWTKRVEAALRSMHHMRKGDPSSKLKPSNIRHIIGDQNLGDFERILQQILTFDSNGRSSQARAASPGQCQPDILADFDDYPRGSSDTNSEDTERDRKAVFSTPVISSIFPSHQVRETPLVSLGLVECQQKEKLEDPTSCINEGSKRVEEFGITNQAREISDTDGELVSRTFTTDKGKLGAPDSYANWLDRHSKELGWNNTFKYQKVANLNEQETSTGDCWSFPNEESRVGSCDLKPLQRHVNGFQSNCTRSWTNQDGLPEFQLHKRDDEGPNVAHLKGEQTEDNGNVEVLVAFKNDCLTSSRSQGIQEHTSDFCLFQPVEHVNHSFGFSQDFHLNDDSHALVRSFQIPSPSYFVPGTNLEHQHDSARPDLSDWAKNDSGRSYKPTLERVSPLESTSPMYISKYEGATTVQNPYPMLETPSNGSRGGSSCSKLNFKVETPPSILSKGSSLVTNAEYREKVTVCVRMRPFNEHEKVCPLRQLLCVMGKKVVVKEYGGPTLRRSFDNNETELLEFSVDCVLDDSYLQAFRVEKKEDSQRRMYESIGLPCLEYALDGYNTTVLAYGQVGTGKTYTMIGDGSEEGSGLMPRLAKDLMNQLNTDFKGEFEVQVSYLEIYQEKIRDLLAAQKSEPQASRGGSMRSNAGSFLDCSDESTYENSVDYETASNASFLEGTPRSWRPERIPSVYFDIPQKKEYLKVREHPVTGPYVEGLLWKNVTTWQDLETVMLQGAANRTLAATSLNKLSSRGHTLFTIKLIRGGRRFVHGCSSPSFSLINLVDLAGTEKPQSAKRTSLERLDESRYINRSLAQLNDVILNLSRNKKFISYRSSALTWLLRDSLGGNSKLFLIANISPAEQDFQESVNTLRYASKANRIHRIVSSDPYPKKQLLVRMKKEIQVLHNLVQDLTKKKIAECVSEGLRCAQQHLPVQCQGSAYEPTGVHNLTKNKIAECVSEELRRAHHLPLQCQGLDYDHGSTKNKIAECVNEELRGAQQHIPLQCQAAEYEPTGMYIETTNLPELFS